MASNLNLKGTLLLFVVVFAGVFSAMWVDRYFDKQEAAASIRGDVPPLRHTGLGIEGAPFDFSSAATLVVPSVVNIDTAYVDERITGFMEVPGGKGSGVVIAEDGYIVTNAHVIRHPRYRSEFRLADRVIVRTSEGREYDAKFVGADLVSDLAILKVDSGDLQPVELGDSDDIMVGEWVMTVGNQLGLDNSVSVGVISSKHRWHSNNNDQLILIDAIQTDATINSGNSGGALCNSMGQVIGINSMMAAPYGVSAGVGFAIPINHVQRISADILQFGKARYAVLGIKLYRTTISMRTARFRETLIKETGHDNVPEYGILIERVIPDYPAGQAGITANSVVMEIDGRRLYTNVDYHRTLMEKRPDDIIEIKYWSRGEVKEVSITAREE